MVESCEKPVESFLGTELKALWELVKLLYRCRAITGFRLIDSTFETSDDLLASSSANISNPQEAAARGKTTSNIV